MEPSDIKEGCSYGNHKAGSQYFRQVEFIVDAPGRPGGKVVAWSTDGFGVQDASGASSGKTRGKCGLSTFAHWADYCWKDREATASPEPST